MSATPGLLTEDELTRLERLDRIASSAPWMVNEQDGDVDCPDDGDHDSVGACDWSDIDKQAAIEARNALFDLIQEVRRLRAVLKLADAAIDFGVGICTDHANNSCADWCENCQRSEAAIIESARLGRAYREARQ